MLIRKIDTDNYQLFTEDSIRQGSLAELALLTEGNALTLIIPASSCTLRQHTFSAHEKKLLNKIIPWSLEEELVDSVGDLHFVIETIPTEFDASRTTAAVCYLEKSVLELEVNNFIQAGIPLAACIPEIQLIPWQPGQWTIAVSNNDECLIRSGFAEGLTCNRENFTAACKLLLAEQGAPEKFVIYSANPGEALSLEAIDSEESVAVTFVEREYTQLLSAAAEDIEPGKTLNLLTDEFTPRLPWQSIWRHWRVAAVLLIGLGILDVSARIIETSKLESLTSQLDEEIISVYRQVVPSGAVVDPMLQLQRRLSALEGSSDTGFVALLSKAAPVIMNNPDLEVENLNYSERDDALQLTLVTSDFSTAELVRSQLANLGLQAELTGSTSSSEGNRSSLSISNNGLNEGVSG